MHAISRRRRGMENQLARDTRPPTAGLAERKTETGGKLDTSSSDAWERGSGRRSLDLNLVSARTGGQRGWTNEVDKKEAKAMLLMQLMHKNERFLKAVQPRVSRGETWPANRTAHPVSAPYKLGCPCKNPQQLISSKGCEGFRSASWHKHAIPSGLPPVEPRGTTRDLSKRRRRTSLHRVSLILPGQASRTRTLRARNIRGRFFRCFGGSRCLFEARCEPRCWTPRPFCIVTPSSRRPTPTCYLLGAHNGQSSPFAGTTLSPPTRPYLLGNPKGTSSAAEDPTMVRRRRFASRTMSWTVTHLHLQGAVKGV